MRIAVTGAINSTAAKAKIVIWPISLPSAISKLFNVEGIQSCSFYDDYRHSGGVTRTEIIARHRSSKPRVWERRIRQQPDVYAVGATCADWKREVPLTRLAKIPLLR